VPAHNYTFSFEPNPDWSAVYAGSGEIFDYFQTFAKKYELQKYIQFSKQVVRATWNVEAGGYNVKIQDLSNGNIIEDYCHILINAGGILNAWKWPQIPGLDKFKGKLLHTAAWDPSILVSNKVVGLIGNG
jgi:cation diffusion facilitator CzcD-associated flavoprotein CzcO